jgi:hypothetical protein
MLSGLDFNWLKQAAVKRRPWSQHCQRAEEALLMVLHDVAFKRFMK